MSPLKHLKITRVLKHTAMAAVAAAALGSAPAYAVDTVWDPGVNTTLVAGFASTGTAIGSVTAELQAILNYLMGVTNGGNDLVGTIASINDKLAHANANGDQQQAFDDTNSRRRVADQMMIQQQMKRVPTADGCAETAYAGGRGAAAAGTAAVKTAADQKILTNMTNAHNASNNMANVVLTRAAAGFCTATDASRGRINCSGQGTMPGADLLSTSLTSGAVQPNSQTNVTLNTAQQTAAAAVIKNIVTPLPPGELPGTTEKSVKGQQYLALMYIMTARASAAVDALTDMASIRYANPALSSTSSVNAATGAFGQTWTSSEVKTLYGQLFPNQVFPTQPSEWETLRYDIFSRYADANGADSWQAKSASFTTEESLREIARMSALQLRLSELQIERQEDGNKILAAILGQSLQPVNSDTLETAKNLATSTSTSTATK